MKSEEPNNKGNAQAPYASPDVKVVEIKAQGVLCQSGDTEQYGNTNDPDWGF